MFLVAGIIGFICVMALYLSSSLMVAGNLFLCMIILLVAAVIKGMFGKNKTYMTAFIAVVVTLPTIFWAGYYGQINIPFASSGLLHFLIEENIKRQKDITTK